MTEIKTRTILTKEWKREKNFKERKHKIIKKGNYQREDTQGIKSET